MKVYLAGPDVFRLNAKEYGAALKKACSGFGIVGMYPFDNEVNPSKEDTSSDVAEHIFHANLKMIQDCDAVLANVERFRGPSCDVGTAFEMGYAMALKKPIVAYNTDEEEYKVIVDLMNIKDGMNIEDFGLSDNLMIWCSPISMHKDLLSALSWISTVKVLKQETT